MKRPPSDIGDRRAHPGRRTTTQERMTMTYATSRRPSILLAALVVLLLLLAGAPVAAHGGSVPAKPTGLTATGFHGGIALDHEIVSPYVKLSWYDPGDTSITHYRVLRRDVGTHENGHFIVIDSDSGSAQVQYFDHAVEKDRRYVYRIIAVNDHGESRPSGSAKANTCLVAIVPFPGPEDASADR